MALIDNRIACFGRTRPPVEETDKLSIPKLNQKDSSNRRRQSSTRHGFVRLNTNNGVSVIGWFHQWALHFRTVKLINNVLVVQERFYILHEHPDLCGHPSYS